MEALTSIFAVTNRSFSLSNQWRVGSQSCRLAKQDSKIMAKKRNCAGSTCLLLLSDFDSIVFFIDTICNLKKKLDIPFITWLSFIGLTVLFILYIF